jgi:hypothetical protein
MQGYLTYLVVGGWKASRSVRADGDVEGGGGGGGVIVGVLTGHERGMRW